MLLRRTEEDNVKNLFFITNSILQNEQRICSMIRILCSFYVGSADIILDRLDCQISSKLLMQKLNVTIFREKPPSTHTYKPKIKQKEK